MKMLDAIGPGADREAISKLLENAFGVQVEQAAGSHITYDLAPVTIRFERGELAFVPEDMTTYMEAVRNWNWETLRGILAKDPLPAGDVRARDAIYLFLIKVLVFWPTTKPADLRRKREAYNLLTRARKRGDLRPNVLSVIHAANAATS